MTDEQLNAAGRAWQKHMSDGDHPGALAAMREVLQPALRDQWPAGYKHGAQQGQNCAPLALKPHPHRYTP